MSTPTPVPMPQASAVLGAGLGLDGAYASCSPAEHVLVRFAVLEHEHASFADLLREIVG
jgi:hypothetical protein